MKKSLLRKAGLIGSLAVSVLAMPHVAVAEEASYYSCDFNTSNLSSLGFSVVDANGDGTTWTPQTTELTFRALDNESVSAMYMTPTFIGNAQNDDWLYSPSIRFEAGKTYNVKFLMAKLMFAAIPEAFEIKLGKSKNSTAMTTVLVPKSGLPEKGGNSLWSFNAVVSVETTGDYYIGIHAEGKPGQKLGIASLDIKNGVAMVTPAAVTDLTVTPDATGDKKAVITFTAPTKAKDNSTLTALSKIEVRRNGDLVETIPNPTPGTPQRVENIVAVSAIYTYSVVAFTEAGGGDMASATTFVGINTPAPVNNLTVENTANRKARITWEAPSVDRDGYPIPASLLKYDVIRTPLYSNESETVVENFDGLNFEDTLPEPVVTDDPDAEPAPAQQFYIYSVVAKTSEGTAGVVKSNPLPMGEPYTMPYNESFARGRASHLFTSIVVDGNNYWSQTTDFEDVSSSDGDNGMIYLNGKIGGASAMLTGLTDLSPSTAPTLNFYTYNIAGADPADNTLEVVVTATDGVSKSFGEYAPAMGWNKTILRLDEFIGKTIRIAFIGRRKNNTELFLDNIAVSNIFRHDLKAEGISIPEKVKSSEPFEITVDVLNFGSEISGDYAVTLFCDEEEVGSYHGTALPVGAHDMVSFTHTQGILAPEEISYHAVITYAADEDMENNTTSEAKVTVRKNAYPIVTDLGGSLNNGIVSLNWGEPDTSKARPYETLETFDQYDSWANSNVGEWVFVDCDKAQISGFSEGNMPGIADYSQQSWWVFDNSHEDFNNGSFNTLSGNKFLASMVSGIKGEGYVQNDDWAISPELFGGAQTIVVNARSYSMLDFETFEVLYSTGSVDPADFISLQTFKDIPSEYTPYEVELPDGAKRFAIRNISLGKYVLMVDDVTYIPVGSPAAFSINGYNVYRDGIKINDMPVEENEFKDTDCGDGNHSYNVTVLYSAGESMFSNDFNPTESSIDTPAETSFTVSTRPGALVISNALAPVSIYTPSGHLEKLQRITGSTRIDLQAGVYFVRIDGKTYKVVIR